MYTSVPNVVIDKIAVNITGGALKTLLAMLRLKKENVGNISQLMIAHHMNIGRRSVIRHMQELESLGYLSKSRDVRGKVIGYELILSNS